MLSRNAVTIFVVVVAEFFVSSRVFGAIGFGFGLLGALVLTALGVFILRRNLSQIPAALQDFVNPLAGTTAEPRAASSSDVATKLGLNAVGALLLIIPGFLCCPRCRDVPSTGAQSCRACRPEADASLPTTFVGRRGATVRSVRSGSPGRPEG